jgi:hypothetical protein
VLDVEVFQKDRLQTTQARVLPRAKNEEQLARLVERDLMLRVND